MTYVGKPPPVLLWRAQRRDSGSRARRREIALAYEEREKLELSFYAAEAKWLHVFAALRAAGDTGAVVATRQARHQLALADYVLRAAYSRLLAAHTGLHALLTEVRRRS